MRSDTGVVNDALHRWILLVATAALLALPQTAVAASQQAAPAPGKPAVAATAVSAPAGDVDGEDAAKRRAASSDFEREKLDSKAFAAEDKKASESKDASSGGGAGSMVRALFGLVIVLGAIFGVHWLLRKWGQSRLEGVSGRSGVIDVVATTNLAQGRALHLVRVGGELVLVGATDQSITRIGDFDATAIAQNAGDAGHSEFQSTLSGAMFAGQPGVPAGMGGASSADQPFVRRFLDNLRLSTAR